ncbi:MAG: ankyrin repeat domain-containing protein [Lachnospiraceae bacterium]|nr:ankyrin repeat domain-containing protein [Lachnospiraceae bacterium]
MRQEEKEILSKLQKHLYKHWKEDYYWWDRKLIYSSSFSGIPKEVSDTVSEYVGKLSIEALEVTEDMDMGFTNPARGLSVFHHLVWHNYFELVKELLHKGINVNLAAGQGAGNDAGVYTGMTPIHMACYLGNYPMAKLLVEHGADTAVIDSHGRNCLHYLGSDVYEDNLLKHNVSTIDTLPQKLKILELIHADIHQQEEQGLTPLLQLMAIKYGRYDDDGKSRTTRMLMKPFIELGASLEDRDENGNTPLLLACKNSALTAALYMILEKQADINAVNQEGDTALHLAAKAETDKSFGICCVLLEQGADINAQNKEGITPKDVISKITWGEWESLIKKARLSEKNTILNRMWNLFQKCGQRAWEDSDYYTFVMYQLKKLLKETDRDDDEEMETLLKLTNQVLKSDCVNYECLDILKSANLDFTMRFCCDSTITCFRDYLMEKNPSEFGFIKKMFALEIDMETDYIAGRTPICLLAKNSGEMNKINMKTPNEKFGGLETEVEEKYENLKDIIFLSSIESMEKTDADGYAAIHYVAKNSHMPMMMYMIERGVNVNLVTDYPAKSGLTPLHIACMWGNPYMVEMLMEAGADDTTTDALGKTAAHFAVEELCSFQKNSEKKISLLVLLKHIDIPENEGKTPLILLQSLEKASAFSETLTLLEMGADVNHADNEGTTPLMAQAKNHCQQDIIKELLKAGADINARDHKGNNALYYALLYGHTAVARYLVKKGADCHIVNNEGKSPIELAAVKGYNEVLEEMM